MIVVIFHNKTAYYLHILTLPLLTPQVSSLSRINRLSGIKPSSRLLKLVVPKYASKLVIGSTVQSLSSGLLAMV